jgi:hypothetical protein
VLATSNTLRSAQVCRWNRLYLTLLREKLAGAKGQHGEYCIADDGRILRSELGLLGLLVRHDGGAGCGTPCAVQRYFKLASQGLTDYHQP